jgi:hypothetical protein
MSPQYRVEIIGRQFIVVDPSNEIASAKKKPGRPSKSAGKKTKDGRRPDFW